MPISWEEIIMAEKKVSLDTAKQELEITLDKTIQRIDDLGVMSTGLYESLNSLQDLFDSIRGIPDEKRLQYQTLEKMRDAWKSQANDIMEEAKKGTYNSKPGMNGFETGFSALNITPSLASGLATCFETLSLGLLSPSLGGLPTLAVALAIGTAPVVDLVAVLAAGLIWTTKKVEKDCARDLFIRVYDRNNKAYKRAITEINERIKRIEYEKAKLDRGIEIIKEFGINYSDMTDDQKYELGTYLNLMLSSTQLVVNPIESLKPHYSDMDFDRYILSLNDLIDNYSDHILQISNKEKITWQMASEKEGYVYRKEAVIRSKTYAIKHKTLLMFLCNFLYKIQLNVSEELVLCKCLMKNEQFLKTYEITTKDVNIELLDATLKMLSDKLGTNQTNPSKTAKKKKSVLQQAQEEAQEAVTKTNVKIVELGENISDLNDALSDIQEYFDKVRNLPSEQIHECEQAKETRLLWKQQAEKIEKDYENECKKSVGGAVGAGVGVAVAAMGPSAAMGVATTFGVASTGTAISSLSGAAATNAALAWIGGGALSAGGGGMAAGEAFLSLAGPIGWTIASVSILASGIMLIVAKQDQKRLEKVFTLISKRDVKNYELAIAEINERIKKINNETSLLKDALIRMETYGLDYSSMTEKQQYELGSYVNLVSSSTALITNPIIGVQPKYTKEDLERYLSIMYMTGYPEKYIRDKETIVFLANLLYQVEMEEKDKELLGKSIKTNKELLQTLNINKKNFDPGYIDLAIDAVKFKYVI